MLNKKREIYGDFNNLKKNVLSFPCPTMKRLDVVSK